MDMANRAFGQSPQQSRDHFRHREGPDALFLPACMLVKMALPPTDKAQPRLRTGAPTPLPRTAVPVGALR